MVAKHVSLIRNDCENERSDSSVMSRANTNEPEPAIIEEVASFLALERTAHKRNRRSNGKKVALTSSREDRGLRHDEHLFIE